MNIYHVLSDGSRVSDITGRVVRVKDAEAVYNLIHSINRNSNARKTATICERGSENKKAI